MREQDVAETVRRRLEQELGRRGLLLTDAQLAAADADIAAEGKRLLRAMLTRCYPHARDDPSFEVAFASERTAARLSAALVFGAATARLLAPEVADEVMTLCAIFNLGIGLIDSLCDGSSETGLALLGLLDRHGLVAAAAEPRARGWLCHDAPPALASEPTAAFTIEIVETFFASLHDAYGEAADAELRHAVGARLQAALKAERRSVDPVGGERSVESSRLTSVLPFVVIETLARREPAAVETAGTLIGEALWRIDDLVDLCDDAASGALNALLVLYGEPGRAVETGAVARAAAQAGDALRDGLALAGGERRSFLCFVQRYAGVGPSAASITSSNSSSSTGRSTSGGI